MLHRVILIYFSNFSSKKKNYNIETLDEGNHALQEFLVARNPKQQHSCTLESYLIKPIQRILKYPLLLQQLRNLTDSRADEHLHLCGKRFSIFSKSHILENLKILFTFSTKQRL